MRIAGSIFIKWGDLFVSKLKKISKKRSYPKKTKKPIRKFISIDAYFNKPLNLK